MDSHRVAISLYDPKRIYKAVDEYQTLTLTVGFFSLAIAGVLYFTFRDISRLLMLYALASMWVTMMAGEPWSGLSIVLHAAALNIPAGADRRCWRGGAARGCDDRRIPLGRTGLVGYLDDDLAKHGNGLPVLGTLEEVEDIVEQHNIDNVVLALPPQAHERINLTVSRLHRLPVQVRVVPDYFSLALYRATVDDFGGIPMINLRDPALSPYQRLVKRTLDLMVGGALTCFHCR